MPDLSQLNPTGRFTGLAAVYARHRPDYPKEAIDLIVQQARLGPESLVIDVGCGTGISTRLLAERGLRVIGIEPNEDMRREAEETVGQAFQPASADRNVCPTNIDFRPGQAEHTGLPDACCDAVVAAQAFHWFKQDETLAEFQRILKPRGWVFLMWNERDDTDEFTAAITDRIRRDRDARDIERTRTGETLVTHPLFEETRLRQFPHFQEMDSQGLIGRAASISYAPREPAAAAAFCHELLELFNRCQKNGHVTLRYQTLVYYGKKA